jgi:hypothetical protein
MARKFRTCIALALACVERTLLSAAVAFGFNLQLV